MPIYPPHLLGARLGGDVRLALTVDTQGRVANVRSISGRELLLREAVAAALQWRYEPASEGGVPVESEVEVLFTFNPVRRQP